MPKGENTEIGTTKPGLSVAQRDDLALCPGCGKRYPIAGKNTPDGPRLPPHGGNRQRFANVPGLYGSFRQRVCSGSYGRVHQ